MTTRQDPVNYWITVAIRIVGLLLGIHEALTAQAERPVLLGFYLVLMGLPTFAKRDAQVQAVKRGLAAMRSDDRDEERQP